MVINVIPLFDAHCTSRYPSGIRACQLRDSNSCHGVGKGQFGFPAAPPPG
jgi:hypothetical protein